MAPRRLALTAALLLILAACSSGGGSGKASAGDLVVQVASYDLATGAPARFTIGVITLDQRLVGYGTVDLRFAYVGTKEKANPSPFGPPVAATYLPIHGSTVPTPAPATPEIVRSSDTRGVYAAQASFDKAGFWEVEATATLEGKARRGKGAFAVNPKHAVPAPGDPALATETLTLTTPDVPRPAIDSRAGSGGVIPDADLHRTTIATSLAAKRPFVAVFATPVYCTSRFCGPVTDLVEELSRQYGDRADFVHVEVWRDFQANTVNKSAADWIYRDDSLTEPWVFVVGADGRIAARFDNVVTRGELEPLLKALPVIGPAAR